MDAAQQSGRSATDASPARAPVAPLRLYRPENPTLALGLAVSHLMIRPAFAKLRFGAWSRILVGQINRKHYWFVAGDGNRIVGFLGWAETSRATAEAWLDNRGGFSGEEASGGDCIVFNAWSAAAPGVNGFLLETARTVIQGKEMIYFKRYYADGSVRPVRLSVNDFVEQHLRRTRMRDELAE